MPEVVMAEVAPRPWKVQAMEAREKEKMASLIRKKLEDLSMTKAELAVWVEQYKRICSEIKDPDYSGMTEDERAAEAERVRQEVLEEAARLKLAGDLTNGWIKEREARILDFDPKRNGVYYNRLRAVDLLTFDLDEESPIGPRRFTRETYQDGEDPETCMALNILSVKIACSDVGFPIQVYGSVIARDSTDYKCLYLFRRDRDDCQLINSEVEPLILTGPKRGLALLDYNYVETDLKIKDHQGKDRELSKGILNIRGVETLNRCRVETRSIETRLSTVDVLYAVVRDAVEGSFVIKVVKGKFDGTITAHTTSVQEKIVVYDSKVAGAQSRRHGRVRLQLMRPALSVFAGDKLIVVANTSSCDSACREFTPAANGTESAEITLDAAKNKIKVTVAWSIMDP